MPVLGNDAFGQVSAKSEQQKWRWEFAAFGVEGDEHGSYAAALTELRTVQCRMFPGWSQQGNRRAHLLHLKELLYREKNDLEALQDPMFVETIGRVDGIISQLGAPGALPRNPFPGFRNFGNTCYANAVLQCLFHCNRVRAQWSHGGDDMPAQGLLLRPA